MSRLFIPILLALGTIYLIGLTYGVIKNLSIVNIIIYLPFLGIYIWVVRRYIRKLKSKDI